MRSSVSAPPIPQALVAEAVGDSRTTAALSTPAVLRIALVLLCIANLGHIPVFSTGERDAAVHVNDFLMLAVLTTGALGMAWSRRARLDDVTALGLAFATIGVISAFVSAGKYSLTPFELVVSLSYLARWLFYFALYFVLINALSLRDVIPAFRALELCILIFAGFGIIQSAFLPNFAQIVFPSSRAYVDWDPQYHRLVSTILDPNFAGALILTVLLMYLARLSVGLPVAWWRLLLLSTALVLTASRSSVLAFLVGGVLLLLIRGLSKRLIRYAGALLLLLLAASPKLMQFAAAYNKLQLNDPSALKRIIYFLRGITVFLANPVLGIGFNTWGFVQERFGWERLGAGTYSIDGGLLFVAITTGLVGVVFFSAMLIRVIRRCRMVWRDRAIAPEYRAIAIGAAVFTLSLLVHTIFSNSLFNSFVIEPLFLFWAMTRIIHEQAPRVLGGEPRAAA